MLVVQLAAVGITAPQNCIHDTLCYQSAYLSQVLSHNWRECYFKQ